MSGTDTKPPGGSTKPLSEAVAAALAKAKAKADEATTIEAEVAESGLAAISAELEPDSFLTEVKNPDSPVFGSDKSLDKALRLEARTIARSMVEFKRLIVQARSQRIHETLGFKSWTAYVADVIGTEMKSLPVDDRRQIVALLAGEGMSNRAIADAVGVNEITVRRDKDQVRHDVAPETSPLPPEEQAAAHERIRSDRDKIAKWNQAAEGSDKAASARPTAVTGRDGKQYPAKPKPKSKPDVPVPSPARHTITIPDTIEGAKARLEEIEAEMGLLPLLLMVLWEAEGRGDELVELPLGTLRSICDELVAMAEAKNEATK